MLASVTPPPPSSPPVMHIPFSRASRPVIYADLLCDLHSDCESLLKVCPSPSPITDADLRLMSVKPSVCCVKLAGVARCDTDSMRARCSRSPRPDLGTRS